MCEGKYLIGIEKETQISLQVIVGWAGPSWSVMDAAVTNDLAGFRC